MADSSLTGTFKMTLPPDLVHESKRAVKPKGDHLKVEGWRHSWLARISELFLGRE
jgi:hypothetical protein